MPAAFNPLGVVWWRNIELSERHITPLCFGAGLPARMCLLACLPRIHSATHSLCTAFLCLITSHTSKNNSRLTSPFDFPRSCATLLSCFSVPCPVLRRNSTIAHVPSCGVFARAWHSMPSPVLLAWKPRASWCRPGVCYFGTGRVHIACCVPQAKQTPPTHNSPAPRTTHPPTGKHEQPQPAA